MHEEGGGALLPGSRAWVHAPLKAGAEDYRLKRRLPLFRTSRKGPRPILPTSSGSRTPSG